MSPAVRNGFNTKLALVIPLRCLCRFSALGLLLAHPPDGILSPLPRTRYFLTQSAVFIPCLPNPPLKMPGFCTARLPERHWLCHSGYAFGYLFPREMPHHLETLYFPCYKIKLTVMNFLLLSTSLRP